MDASPFSKLSPELRNLIYDYALEQDNAFVLTRWTGSSGLRQRRTNKKIVHPLALSYTCKTIYEESIQLFYVSNTFVIKCQRGGASADNVTNWLDQLGTTSLAAVRDVSVTIDPLSINSWHRSERRRLQSLIDALKAAADRCPACSFELSTAVRLSHSFMSYYLECELDFDDLAESWQHTLEKARMYLNEARDGYEEQSAWAEVLVALELIKRVE